MFCNFRLCARHAWQVLCSSLPVGRFSFRAQGPACSSEPSVHSPGSLTPGHPDSSPGAGAARASGCPPPGARVLHSHRQASCSQPHLQEVVAPCPLPSQRREPRSSAGPAGVRVLGSSHGSSQQPAGWPPPQPPLTAARSCSFSAREPPSQEQLRHFRACDGQCVGAGPCVHPLVPPLPPKASAPPPRAGTLGSWTSAQGKAVPGQRRTGSRLRENTEGDPSVLPF